MEKTHFAIFSGCPKEPPLLYGVVGEQTHPSHYAGVGGLCTFAGGSPLTLSSFLFAPPSTLCPVAILSNPRTPSEFNAFDLEIQCQIGRMVVVSGV
ncbi:hypothetical protein YC2023_052290 [Brassica napus]